VASPSPVPFPLPLVVKKGFEDAVQCRFVHSRTGIGNGKEHVFLNGHSWALAAVRLINIDVAGLDDEFPASRHGVARVDYQVHDHLLDLAGIRFYLSKLRFQDDSKIDIFSNQPPDQRFNFPGDLVQVEHLRLKNLLHAVSEELLGEGSGVLRGLLNL